MTQTASLLFRGAAEARPVGVISEADEAALREVGLITGIDEVTLKYFIVVWNRIKLRTSEGEALRKQAHLFKSSGLERESVENLLELFREHRRRALDEAKVDGPSIAFIMGEFPDPFPERAVFQEEKEIWEALKKKAAERGEPAPVPEPAGIAEPEKTVPHLPEIPPMAMEQLRTLHAANLMAVERTGHPLVRSVPISLLGKGGAKLATDIPEGMVRVIDIRTGKATDHDQATWDAAHGPPPQHAPSTDGGGGGGGGGGGSASELSDPQIPASQTSPLDSTTGTPPSHAS